MADRCWWVKGMLMGALAAIAGAALADPCPSSAEANQATLAQVREQLEQAFAADGLRLELEPVSELPAIAQPEIRVLSRGLRSRVAVELNGTACGRAQQVTVWFKLRALREAWVYGRNAKAGRALAEAQPQRQWVDLAAAQVSTNDLASSPEGLWLVEDVRAGLPVLTRQLQVEPLVRRDDVVAVVVYGPGLMLKTQGRAMRPGVLGETVPVLVNGADSSLLTVVAGKGEVHVGQQ